MWLQQYYSNRELENLPDLLSRKTSTRNKIVLFVHISKCGGSSMNDLLKQHLKPFYDSPKYYNNNGNPWCLQKGAKESIKFALYDEPRLDSFIDLCHSIQAQYVCTEFSHFQDLNLLQKFNPIICLRDPLARYKSQLKFYKDPIKRQGQPNMMVRTLCNKYWKNISNCSPKEENDMLVHAKQAVKMMDIIILERPETHKVLQKYGIDVTKLKHLNSSKKKTGTGTVTICEKSGVVPTKWLLKKTVQAQSAEEAQSVVNIDVAKFKRDNRLDYALYDYACKLAPDKDARA